MRFIKFEHNIRIRILWLILNLQQVFSDDIFKTDLGDDMKIGLADGGYRSVELKCGSNSMIIHLKTEKDFDGIIYTRGSFYEKDSPCVLTPDPNQDKTEHVLRFNFDQCQTEKNGEIYTNTLILQHDKQLIMPGDAAFNLECDFGKPKVMTVNANLNGDPTSVISRISLTDADPSARNKKCKKSFIESESSVVEITPEKAKLLKKIEL